MILLIWETSLNSRNTTIKFVIYHVHSLYQTGVVIMRSDIIIQYIYNYFPTCSRLISIICTFWFIILSVCSSICIYAYIYNDNILVFLYQECICIRIANLNVNYFITCTAKTKLSNNWLIGCYSCIYSHSVDFNFANFLIIFSWQIKFQSIRLWVCRFSITRREWNMKFNEEVSKIGFQYNINRIHATLNPCNSNNKSINKCQFYEELGQTELQ